MKKCIFAGVIAAVTVTAGLITVACVKGKK